MTPPASTDQPLRVNWGVVVTNAVGVVIGLALTASVSGVVYLVWRLPSQQEQILRNQEKTQDTLKGMAAELERLERNDRVQDERLTRIEASRR